MWRAVVQDGEIVDVFLQRRRDGNAAKRFFKRLLKTHRNEPRKIVTDKLRSYGVAHRALIPDTIYDTMQYLKAPVSTICVGQAASMGAVLLAAGEKGKRFTLPNSRIMIHQPLGGFQGQASDISIHAQEILRMRESLNEILALHTGQKLDKIAADTERDFFMGSDTAKEYGIVDGIVERKS